MTRVRLPGMVGTGSPLFSYLMHYEDYFTEVEAAGGKYTNAEAWNS